MSAYPVALPPSGGRSRASAGRLRPLSEKYQRKNSGERRHGTHRHARRATTRSIARRQRDRLADGTRKTHGARRGAITRISAAGHYGFLRDSFLKFVLTEKNKIAAAEVGEISEFLPKIRPNNRCAGHGVERIAYGCRGVCGLHLPRMGR